MQSQSNHIYHRNYIFVIIEDGKVVGWSLHKSSKNSFQAELIDIQIEEVINKKPPFYIGIHRDLNRYLTSEETIIYACHKNIVKINSKCIGYFGKEQYTLFKDVNMS